VLISGLGLRFELDILWGVSTARKSTFCSVCVIHICKEEYFYNFNASRIHVDIIGTCSCKSFDLLVHHRMIDTYHLSLVSSIS